MLERVRTIGAPSQDKEAKGQFRKSDEIEECYGNMLRFLKTQWAGWGSGGMGEWPEVDVA